MAKHTPGPWVTLGRQGNGFDTKFSIKHRSPGRDGGTFCEVRTLHKTAEAIAIAEANARLIAAAPELLSVCEQIAEYLSNGTPVHPGCLLEGELRNAIAKALGGVPKPIAAGE